MRPIAMNEEKSVSVQAITGYASLLNAAHLLAEESALRLRELIARYPDTFPPEVLPPDPANASDEGAHQVATEAGPGLLEVLPS